MSGCGEISPDDGQIVQVGAGEHGIQPILVLHQSTIHRLAVPELTLNDSEGVLYLAAHRGFAVFNVAFPVDGMVTYFGETAGTAVNTEVNL